MDSNLAIHSALEVHEKKREFKSGSISSARTDYRKEYARPSINLGNDASNTESIHTKSSLRSPCLKTVLAELVHKSQLYRVSQPVLKELDKQIRNTQHLITLCDKNGRIIYLQGETHILSKAEEMNFVRGADWSEKAAGSNAVGTCIATKKPIQVFAYEHYCEGAHTWICSAANLKTR